MITYTTTGDVRGNCGHQHKTMSAAIDCQTSDAKSCAAAGGYTDRGIRVVEDGVERHLTPEESEERYAIEEAE